MSFKDSDFRRLALTAAENCRKHYEHEVSPHKIARELVVDQEFIDQLQVVISNCIKADRESRSRQPISDIKKIDLFDQFKDDPLNW